MSKAGSRKIKIWAGTHPDELAALACVDALEANPIANVATGIANPLARQLGKRLVDCNLAGSFPGDKNAQEYERRRAVQVLAESQGFDVVIDLHNNNGYGLDAAIVDRERGATPQVLGFLKHVLGITHLVASDYDGMQKYLPNAIVLETVTSGLGSDYDRLSLAFDRLANDAALPSAQADDRDFSWYKHLGSPHIKSSSPNCLAPVRETLRGFDILPEDIAASLGYRNRKVCLMAWQDEANDTGYWGELCEPIATPDTSAWPLGED